MGSMTLAMVVKVHPVSYQPRDFLHCLVGPKPQLSLFDAPPEPFVKTLSIQRPLPSMLTLK